MLESVFRVADALCKSGCLKFGSFKIKSGALSPYYIDLSGLFSSPKHLRCIVNAVVERLKEIMAFENVDKLASIELRGALLLPSIACEVDLPCVIVRKETKAYGVTGRIVGAEVNKNENILFFDDVLSEGLSKLEGIKPLEELGANVRNVLVVVDREQGGKENLEKLGYKVHTLTKISSLVNCLYQTGNISEEQKDLVLSYIRAHP